MHSTKLKCSNINNILTAINIKQIKFKCMPKYAWACACLCCMAYLMSVYLSISGVIWYELLLFIWLKFYTEKQFLGDENHFDSLLMRLIHIHMLSNASPHLHIICLHHEILNLAWMMNEWMRIRVVYGTNTKEKWSTFTFTLNLEFGSRSWESFHRYRRKEGSRAFIVLCICVCNLNSIEANKIIDLYCVKRRWQIPLIDRFIHEMIKEHVVERPSKCH